MKIVSDTNVFLTVALNEPEKSRIIQMTAGVNHCTGNFTSMKSGMLFLQWFKRQITYRDVPLFCK
jgi:hypothetical protein